MDGISTCGWGEDLETSPGQPSKGAEQGRANIEYKWIHFGQSKRCMVGNREEKARAPGVDMFDDDEKRNGWTQTKGNGPQQSQY